jgi:NTP pyrophosphatase (non-canonical NTP hydrolase)
MPHDLVHLGVMAAVSHERDRQERLKADGRFAYTCADAGIDGFARFAILLEEVGEVARALNEADIDGPNLRAELLQVAAVAVAWVEGIDHDGARDQGVDEATYLEGVREQARRDAWQGGGA